MKSGKLMIGNYVSFLCDLRGEYIVDKVHSCYFKRKTLKNVKPIPLTEDWLFRFGFFGLLGLGCETNDYILEIDKNNTLKVLSRIKVGTAKVVFIFVAYDGIQPLIIKYVHQLQNLYFARTEKKLKIK